MVCVGRTSFAGAEPRVSGLYPEVQFPVPRNTAGLAQLVTWLHDDSNFLESYNVIKDKVRFMSNPVKRHFT